MKKKSLSYKSFNPSLNPLLEEIKKDKKIQEYLSFSQTDSKFIFLDETFIGFCKLFPLEEDEMSTYEIEIAILEEFRGKGLSGLILDDLCHHLFTQDCMIIQLSIDKTNESSIHMAIKNGFVYNPNKTDELKKYGDMRTLIFTKNNYLLHHAEDEIKKEQCPKCSAPHST